MNGRLVIRIALFINDGGDEVLTVSLERPPSDGQIRLACNGNEPEFVALGGQSLSSTTVRDAGRLLFQHLTAHPAIGVQLPAAVQPGVEGGRPVFVELRAPGIAEALPWETLWTDAVEFLGLDARWPVTRIVPPVGDHNPIHLKQFWPPLRIAAILSALSVPAAPEWQILRKALHSVAGQLDVQILALVSEPDLARDIRDACEPGVVVELVPEDLNILRDKVSDFRPHILHVFCHGRMQQRPHIEIAVPSDWMDEAPNRSHRLEYDQIDELSSPVEPAWLAVLNCCEVGAPAGKMYSLARELVNRGSFAAAVAMREPVRPEDANVFSDALFPQILAAVNAVAQAGGRPVEIPFCDLLFEPRRLLCERRAVGITRTMAAASTKEWTLPVLYVRPDPLVLRRGTGPAPTVTELSRQQYVRRAARSRRR